MDEIDNTFVYFWPLKVLSNQLNGLVLAHMSRDLQVVLSFEDSFDEGRILRDPEPTLAVE